MAHSKRSQECEQTLSITNVPLTPDKYKNVEFPLYSGVNVSEFSK
ncbi:hypothetical protein SAMN02745729_1173 [Marinobacterium iners DSM 11526]|jgi:hypothetical protein|uniref:Uncharacterized protein n=1 Tax=Marinobacterium iners DSM 11526 TaxID=1122198 RepID=A0A1H4GLB8_9GAMM|nr:hypothetical protein SAMN02745729_1173 [Marinobacterium iners DSM 11526]